MMTAARHLDALQAGHWVVHVSCGRNVGVFGPALVHRIRGHDAGGEGEASPGGGVFLRAVHVQRREDETLSRPHGIGPKLAVGE